jgi:RNA polymerase sigma-70 factor (ECF subfamily)
VQTNVPIHQTLDHLFRHESGKLVAVLTKIFGPHNLSLAEDVVQDTLLKALHSWKLNGIPGNPSGWLFAAAKNKAIDVIRKEKKHREFAGNQSYLLESEYTLTPTLNEWMNEHSIPDDQLRMIFTCCHPSLPSENQVALVLKTLCGFSVAEIARAFISTPDTIEKRLYRARQKFREQKIAFEIPGNTELEARLENVLTVIYLLFNEGYSSTQDEELVRKDLLEESIRLGELLIENPVTRHPRVFALLALMCFHHARSNTRTDVDGNILLLKDQDRDKWDRALIQKGHDYIEYSASGDRLSNYHLEAAIACEHARARNYAGTNWPHILRYYDLLYQLQPTPVVALNRAVVVNEISGAAEGIKAIEEIEGLDSLDNYYLLHAVLGELYLKTGKKEKASLCFSRAAKLTVSSAQQRLLMEKMRESRESH